MNYIINNKIVREIQNRNGDFESVIVQGLNIFASNRIEVKQDPRVATVEKILASRDCIAHIGSWNLFDICDTIEDAIGTKLSGNWLPSQIGIDATKFYRWGADQGESPYESLNAILLRPEILINRYVNGRSVLEYLMRCDAIALYLTDNKQSFVSFLQGMNYTSDQGFSSDGWILECLKYCNCIVMTTSDDWEFEIIPKSQQDYQSLADAFQVGISIVQTNPWYTQHAEDLVWVENAHYNCLALPGSVWPHS